MKLFLYAIILNPKSTDSCERPELVVGITEVLAENEQQARIHASRAIPKEYLERLSEVEVLVRPF